MAKIRTVYVCSNCGAQSPREMGRCPQCDSWNTLEPRTERPAAAAATSRSAGLSRLHAVPVQKIASDGFARLPVPIEEFSRVLGGGLVPGSLVLIGGDPGVGKSTLMMQVSEALACQGQRVLYVSGEESLSQIGLRARRLGLESDNLLYAAETDLPTVLDSLG